MTERYVYFIKPVGMHGPIKIGCSDMPEGRLKGLMYWSPFPLEIVATTPGSFKLERNIHECFADTHWHGEWFHASHRLTEAIAAIAAGKPVSEAIDLDARLGAIRAAGGHVNLQWTPARRLYQSCFTRLHAATRRAQRITGNKMLRAPPEVHHIPFRIGADGMLPAEHADLLERFCADPVSHCVMPSPKPAETARVA